MIGSKLLISGIALATGAMVLGLGWTIRENAQLRGEMVRAASAADPRVFTLERQIAGQEKRVEAAEAKVAELLKAAKQANSAPAGKAGTSGSEGTVSTEDAVKATIARAKELIKEDKRKEALEEYVKCYREVQAIRPGSSECQSLMHAMRYLGRTYPPAITALAGLRDAALAQWQAQPDRRDLPFEIALLNEQLSDGVGTMAVFDALPPNDRTRQSLAMIARSAFVEAHRYNDALLGKSFGQMMGMIEGISRQMESQDSTRQAMMRKAAIEQTITNIEILTGAEKAAEARLLTEKLLAFDGTDATRVTLQQHVERAQLAKR